MHNAAEIIWAYMDKPNGYKAGQYGYRYLEEPCEPIAVGFKAGEQSSIFRIQTKDGNVLEIMATDEGDFPGLTFPTN